MPQYFVAGYLPDDFDPPQADEATGREIHALNKEMIAAGVRRFACGLGSAESRKCWRVWPCGDCWRKGLFSQAIQMPAINRHSD